MLCKLTAALPQLRQGLAPMPQLAVGAMPQAMYPACLLKAAAFSRCLPQRVLTCLLHVELLHLSFT